MGETLQTTLTALGSVVDFVLEQVGSVVEIILSQPLLFIPFGVIMVYTVIKTCRKLF